MLRIRLSASKDAPTTGQVRERFPRIAKPFSAEGEALTCERHTRSMILSPATPVTGTSLEALCQVLGQCPSLGARTGRALQNGLHTGREQTFGCTIGEGPSVWGALWAMPLAVPSAGGPRSSTAAGARGAGAPTMTIPALPQRARCPLSQSELSTGKMPVSQYAVTQVSRRPTPSFSPSPRHNPCHSRPHP